MRVGPFELLGLFVRYPPSLLYNEYWGSFPPGVKARPGREADHSPPSSAEVENEYELYLLSPQAPPWRVEGLLYLLFVRYGYKVCWNFFTLFDKLNTLKSL
jgi:hypothetical protein